MCERAFVVNLQVVISQLLYRLISSQIIFRDLMYMNAHERLRIATSSSCIKYLKSTCEIHFLLYVVVEIRQLVNEITQPTQTPLRRF